MNRTILVTGANRGIGLAIVKGMSENKNDIILLASRVLADGEKEAKNLGVNVIPVKLDLSSKTSVKKDLEAILEKFSKIDVLINNAGVLHEGNLQTSTYENLENSLQIHVMAPYQMIKTLLPSMIKNQYGRIINFSSGWGSMSEGLTGPFAYSLSKASLNALTLTLSQELPKNVKVNSMCPGWVKTRMGGMDAPRAPEKGAETAIWLANLPEDSPNGKFFRDMKPINW